MKQAVIPTPAKHQLRRAAARVLPTLFFLCVCGVSALLWQFQNQSSVLVGEVEVVEYLVASPQDGTVEQLVPSEGVELGVYVSVNKDQLLVQLDDTATRKQLEIAQNEFTAVSNEVAKEVARLHALESLAMRQIAMQLDADREEDESAPPISPETSVWQQTQKVVEQSLRAVELAQKQLDLRQLDFELSQARAAHAASGGDAGNLELFVQQRNQMADEIFELRSATSVDRITSLGSIDNEPLPATARLLFRSLTNRVRAAETKLVAANDAAERLDVVSPVDGQIEATMVQRQQAVTNGQPLLTVVPKKGTTVVVYAREQSLLRPFAGMRVTLRSRVNPNQQVESAVAAVGPKVEEIPQRHRLNPKQVEWGRPMRIQVPEDWIVEPGSLIDVIVEQS